MNPPEEKEEFLEDWYAILGCTISSTKENIEKSARKLFLKYHPDKTSDPAAPAKFLLVQKAKEILLDETKRKIIDEHTEKILKRKEYDSRRNDKMDSERKRMKEELAERMNAATSKPTVVSDADRVKAEAALRKKKISELREKNAARAEQSAEESYAKAVNREQEIHNIRKQAYQLSDEKLGHVKVKWRREISHSSDTLQSIFSIFGDIEAIDMSQNKVSSATIIFSSSSYAVAAVDAYLISKDFRVSLVSTDSSFSEYNRPKCAYIPPHTASHTAAAPDSCTNNNESLASNTVQKVTVETILSKEADILKMMLDMKSKKKKQPFVTSQEANEAPSIIPQS